MTSTFPATAGNRGSGWGVPNNLTPVQRRILNEAKDAAGQLRKDIEGLWSSIDGTKPLPHDPSGLAVRVTNIFYVLEKGLKRG